ncbi:MAG: glycosyltransferase [Flavobacteriales bacterium]|nr:glycosyltransferase [Flavobacteriales bacterium]
MIVLATYLIVYATLVGGVVLVGFLFHVRKSNQNDEDKKVLASEITVLIPFRNEAKRLDELLSSFVNARKLPKRIVFIDDHSDDGSSELIRKRLDGIPFEILSLPDHVTGKKLALRHGIECCETEYILTFDADVSFPTTYFESIETLPQADMYVLPAILKGDNFSELFYELDVALANTLNTGLSGWLRPIFCSGANLLYRKEVFDEVDDFDSHAHMASGDDTYLLRDFRKRGKDIQVVSDLNVAIHTETPHSFRSFIDQRLRWVGKTTDIGDSLATVSAGLQFILAIAFFALLIVEMIQGNWRAFWIVFITKIAFDLIFFMPYFLRIKRIKSWLLLPIYEVLFPFYSLLLAVLMLFYKPKWKGREIKN